MLERPEFNRYLTRYERAIFLQRFTQDTVPANAPSAILASRDVRDDKFPELAVGGGQATCIIITDDSDLLDLHPFRGIPSSRRAIHRAGRRGLTGSRRRKAPIAWPGTA